MRSELKCRQCGSDHFTLDEVAADQSFVASQDCGRVMGTLGELKEQVVRQVLSRSALRRSG